LKGSLVHGVPAGRAVGLIRVRNRDSDDATTGIVYSNGHSSEFFFSGRPRGDGEKNGGTSGGIAKCGVPTFQHDRCDRQVDSLPIWQFADVEAGPECALAVGGAGRP
jgi:hypothetical protein